MSELMPLSTVLNLSLYSLIFWSRSRNPSKFKLNCRIFDSSSSSFEVGDPGPGFFLPSNLLYKKFLFWT